jgi:tripartite-type tricarboxylate transporter receptor subunit TctC
MKGLNYSFNVAPRDGTFITMAHAEVLQETVLNPDVKFDAKKYEWLGRFTDIVSVGVASKASGVKSLDDARKREVVVGATGFRSWTGFAPMLFNRVAGTKFKIVAGYKGATQMFHAQDQKEVEVVPASWVVVKVNKAQKLAAGELIPIFAISLDRMKELPNVPTITEFGRDEGEKLFLKVFAANGVIGRALAAPPGTNAERVQAIRTGFDRMLQDPAFKAHVAEKKIPLNTLGGAELAKRVNTVLNMSDDQVKKTRAVYNELLAGIKDKK